MAVIDVRELTAHYILGLYGRKKEISAVDNVSFGINKNEILGIAGESGCGKTTLIKVLFGMVKLPLIVLGGSVTYNFGNSSIDLLSSEASDADSIGWQDVSYIPQGSMSVLNPVRRIESTFRDFIETNLPPEEKDEYERLVKDQLFILGLPFEVLKSYPHQLSGGMRQRVIIALATVLKPRVIFADEPSSALDVVAQRGVIQLLKKIQREQQNIMVLVSHDMGIHANLTDRVAIMYAGNIVEEARTKDIFKGALHPYTKYLIGSLPKVGDKLYKASVPGPPPPLANPPKGCRFHPRCPHALDICRGDPPMFVDAGDGHKVACSFVAKEMGL